MKNHPRCPTCPIAGRCVVEWTGHSTYCDWAARGGNHLRRVEELSAAGPKEPVARQAEPDRPTAKEALALTKAMKACPYRSPCGCAGGGGKCGLREEALVSDQDCFDCIRKYDPAVIAREG